MTIIFYIGMVSLPKKSGVKMQVSRMHTPGIPFQGISSRTARHTGVCAPSAGASK